MNRAEFISTLRSALTGKVPANMVEDNVRYYEEYIDAELRQGKSEDEVLKSLGDPRLLAKTVIEANKYAENNDVYGASGRYGSDSNEIPQGSSGKSFPEWYKGLPRWVHTLMTIIMTLMILFVVFTVLQAIFPIIIFVMIGVFIYRMIRAMSQ